MVPAVRLATACALVVLFLASGPSVAQPSQHRGGPTFTHSVVVRRAGDPTLLVDGQPFFFYGAAFFYERIPAPQWRASMLALRALGCNTLDLYVPWNWHELADGDFDFTGRTDARRNLRAVLALARQLHFRLIVRPGPVIRNEWRNGGYPAWLLTRPQYGMPLHDVLEGRYPATATLQNANSDDAAAAWLRNTTHMRYARRWLRTVLREFVPVADLVVAVQLDDDQAAYIDNQTWPAPHVQTYLHALETTVRGVVGSRLPVFINTYEMKVTASAPVWPMGNWYQSDAYSIGEHDRAAIEFSTALLQTQTRFPVAMSEFQAGWLAPPEDPAPRPADPTNTTLALHTLLGMGARGIIDFPMQDTVNPAGWEAPFANVSYAWDAALTADLQPSARYGPTARFGALVRRYGADLAAAQRVSDGAIAYLTSAYDAQTLTNADVFAIAARTQDAQLACRRRHLTCDLVDLRFIGDARLHRYPFIIVPALVPARSFVTAVAARLRRYHRHGGRIVTAPPAGVLPHNGGIPDATLLRTPDGRTAFLDLVNFTTSPRRIARTRVRLPGGRNWDVGPLSVPARDAVLLRMQPSPGARMEPAPAPAPAWKPPVPCTARVPRSIPPSRPTVTLDDRAQDGLGRLTLGNDQIAVTLAPQAGARVLWLGAASDPGCAANSVVTSVGALRDDVEIQPPLSTTDRIGKYTRTFPAGMFNRTYVLDRRTSDGAVASATLHYDAPDVVPAGARFARTLRMRRGERAFTVEERTTFAPGRGAADQRAVRYDSFYTRGAIVIDDRAERVIGFFDPRRGTVTILAWAAGDVEDVQVLPERTSTVVRLRFAPGGVRRTRYALDPAPTVTAARAAAIRERDTLDTSRLGGG